MVNGAHGRMVQRLCLGEAAWGCSVHGLSQPCQFDEVRITKQTVEWQWRLQADGLCGCLLGAELCTTPTWACQRVCFGSVRKSGFAWLAVHALPPGDPHIGILNSQFGRSQWQAGMCCKDWCVSVWQGCMLGRQKAMSDEVSPGAESVSKKRVSELGVNGRTHG